jgi:hypothetical protein
MNLTKLYLLNVPLEADYKHTLHHTSKSAQEKYFKSKAVVKYEDFSYQMKDRAIRVHNHYDEIHGKVNYIMYQNTAYNNKWFYAFIISMKYINDGVTEIYIKTDVMQTWFDEYELKSCFVEREHVKDDTEGKNTVPENLETGEYVCNHVIHDRSMENTVFIVASTVQLDETGVSPIYLDSGLRLYNGVINGWIYYCLENCNEVEEVLGNIATHRTNDSIVSIFVIPKEYVHYIKGKKYLLEDGSPKRVDWGAVNEWNAQTERIFKPSQVNGYIPHNRKLLTYPYSYLLMDNNAGASVVYHWELFEGKKGDECGFVSYGAVTPGGSIRLLPLKYGGVEGENNNYGLNGPKFPVCGWQSDYYTNWLTQNSLNIAVQTERVELASQERLFNSTTSGVSAGIKGDVGGVINSLGDAYFNARNYKNEIQAINAQKQIHAFQSPTVSGNTNTGDVNFTRGVLRFSAYYMSIKEEYARIIDGYFSMYGYQTNLVKVPYTNHRERYWYTKTVGCDVAGAIPNEDIQQIKACYDNGITFWREADDIGNYSDENGNPLRNKSLFKE